MGGKLTTFSSPSIPLFADVVAAEKGEGRRRPTAQQVKYGIYQSLGNWVSVKLIFSSASKGRIRNIGRLANFISFNCKASLPLCDGTGNKNKLCIIAWSAKRFWLFFMVRARKVYFTSLSPSLRHHNTGHSRTSSYVRAGHRRIRDSALCFLQCRSGK